MVHVAINVIEVRIGVLFCGWLVEIEYGTPSFICWTQLIKFNRDSVCAISDIDGGTIGYGLSDDMLALEE